MPQLDSLRTCAVIMVLISHWVREEDQLKFFQWGTLGVLLFFVLSGFLISLILLRIRKEVEEKQEKKKMYLLVHFYIRRTLRIFPIYYVLIIVLFIINFDNIRNSFLYFMFYSSNFLFFFTANWGGYLSHLWTLAVEEQFYIIWPWIILFIPNKHLLNSIIGIITIGPVFRAVMFHVLEGTTQINFISILTPSAFDSFGLGALLAYFRVYKNLPFDFRSLSSKIILYMNIVSYILLSFFKVYLYKIPNFSKYAIMIDQPLLMFNTAVIFLFIISRASIGFKGILKFILENKVIIYLGRISYGLYLYHSFIPLIYSKLNLSSIKSSFTQFFIQFIILVILSSVSWYFIEKPINNLKKYFKYR